MKLAVLLLFDVAAADAAATSRRWLCCRCLLCWDSGGSTAAKSAAAGVAGLPLPLVRCLLVFFFCSYSFVFLCPPALLCDTARRVSDFGPAASLPQTQNKS